MPESLSDKKLALGLGSPYGFWYAYPAGIWRRWRWQAIRGGRAIAGGAELRKRTAIRKAQEALR